MSERRFVIDKVENYHSMAPINIVTESELRHRLLEIVNRWQTVESFALDGAVDILLHGEEEKVYPAGETVITGNIELPPNIDQSSPTYHFSEYINSLKHFPGQPSPTPTRAEWVKWFEKQPLANDYASLRAWANDTQQWFRSMPIVPKE